MKEEYRKADLLEIAHKLKTGKATAEEQAYFDKWYNHYYDELAVFPDEYARDEQEVKVRMHDRLLSLVANDRKSKTGRLSWFRWKYAAAIVLVSGTAFYTLSRRSAKEKSTSQAQAATYDIAPGKQAATLTLSNGKKITLDAASVGKLAEESGVKIFKAADGSLIYTIVNDQQGGGQHSHTLSTAKGETYPLQLPDGTRVWLNAASSLTYMAQFSNVGERRVKLSGEAYFEVAKDPAHPFTVSTGKQEITVLGTHFNVNNYADEPLCVTTLLEGAVRVKTAGEEKILKPGQAAVSDEKGLTVIEANTDLATAWKDGRFVFKRTDAPTVLRQLARWYDIEIAYQGKIPEYTITGDASRNESLSAMLKVLSLSGIHFELKERKLNILP